MQLAVGLGNPGPQYECTRHNVGFLVLDQLADRLRLSITQEKFGGMWAHTQAGERSLGLLKPQTFMNCSGESVAPCVRFYKVDLAQLLVVHDDLDLAAGQLKLAWDRGPGGHNGVRSIEQHLQTRKYWRLRVGVGRPQGRMNPSSYVLQQVKAQDMAEFNELVITAADAATMFFEQGAEAVQQQYH